MSHTAKPRVAVVFGGRSEEHGISCVTAGSVLAAIDRDRYDVIPIGIARDGRWVLESGETDRLRIGASGELPAVSEDAAEVALVSGRDGAELSIPEDGPVPAELGSVDVVFPLLHGPWGEDGTIQGLLEMAGVRYVGAGVLSSAVGMDKHFMKIVFASAALPVLPHVLVTAHSWDRDREAAREACRALGFPVFVKPCRGGSSLGISKVHDESGLDEAIEEACRHDPKVMVEAFAGPGARELECGVLGGLDGAEPEASAVAELVVGGGHDFYDFEAKYLPDEGTVEHIPAEVPDEVAQEMRELAVRAFQALDCEGLARVDFFYLHDGRLVINEINTMPGFTPTSMFPRVWAAVGVDYPTLVDRLIGLALGRGTGLR